MYWSFIIDFNLRISLKNIFCCNLKEANIFCELSLKVWVILICQTSNLTVSVIIPLCCINSHTYPLIRNILEIKIVLHDIALHRIMEENANLARNLFMDRSEYRPWRGKRDGKRKCIVTGSKRMKCARLRTL